jgi:hypothetical protein
MDPEYLQMLLQMLEDQQAGGYPAGAFVKPEGMAVPQYRTQYTDYVSDGTVRDMLGKALPNTNDFSADALFDVDPALKGLISSAVAEAGHDPYATMALFDQDQYKKALLDAAMQAESLPAVDLQGQSPDDLDYGSYAQMATDQVGTDTQVYRNRAGQMDPLEGVSADMDSKQALAAYKSPYQMHFATNLVNEKMEQYRQVLDDFITQAAPSNERNLNNVDYNWERLGGMPYRGQGSGAIDYAGSGPAFPSQGGGGDPVAAIAQQIAAARRARVAAGRR